MLRVLMRATSSGRHSGQGLADGAEERWPHRRASKGLAPAMLFGKAFFPGNAEFSEKCVISTILGAQ